MRCANSGTVYYFLQDHLGSTRVITNSSGTTVRDSDYYPYGAEKQGSAESRVPETLRLFVCGVLLGSGV